MLKQILDRLEPLPVHTELARTGDNIFAAVLLPLVNDPIEPQIVLTKRSENLSSHSGQVAFPGGKRDLTDRDLLETALRETWEEIDLPPREVNVLAELPPHNTLQRTFVLPYVGLVKPGIPYTANPSELDAVFTVPVSYFLDRGNLSTYSFNGGSGPREMPCYHYQGFVIWGFTLSVLVGFLNYTLDAGLELRYPPDILKQRGSQVAYSITPNPLVDA